MPGLEFSRRRFQKTLIELIGWKKPGKALQEVRIERRGVLDPGIITVVLHGE
jgi:hypothetical protein